MNPEHINAFTEATIFVLKQALADDLIMCHRPETRGDSHVSNGVAAIIGISGVLEGHVICDMESATAIAIASVMNGENLVGIDRLVRSTICELANMIAGQATIKLSAQGYPCNISPPTFVTGEQARIFSSKGDPHLVASFKTKGGTFTLSLALSEV